MTGPSSASAGTSALLAGYDDTLPVVFGYLVRRCPDRTIAEDLTSETYLAALDAVRRNAAQPVAAPWLIGIARHKLADHYRRAIRTPHPVADPPEHPDDRWDVELDRLVAESTLASLSPIHRLVLTLRYVDDCTVADCARHLDRTVGATEALLTRAKRAFRAAYPDDWSHAREGGRR